MLAGGNFVFALAHGDCLISSHGHITCEMECCIENPCLDESDSEVSIADTEDACCKTHVEEAIDQDFSPPIITKLSENLKYFNSIFLLSERTETRTYTSSVKQKFKTADITLLTSNFRI